MKRMVAVISLLAAILPGATSAGGQPKEISAGQAEMLARAAAETTPLAQHDFVFDPAEAPGTRTLAVASQVPSFTHSKNESERKRGSRQRSTAPTSMTIRA